VTDTTSGHGYVPIPASSSSFSRGARPDPTKSVQMVVGPDGQSYPVFTYIILVKPNGTSGYVKRSPWSCAIAQQHADSRAVSRP